MSPDKHLSPQVQDLLYAGEHRLLQDDVGRAVQQVLSAGISDGFSESILHNRVHKHRVAQAFTGAFALPQLSNNGELVLGRDLRHHANVRCPLQYLNAHCLTVAGSGSGKTYKAQVMALQIARHVEGLWLFDLRKREFCILQPWFARLGIELIVLPGREMRLNPLQVPDGVEAMDWASRVADLLVGVLGLPQRATKLLHTTILELYENRGILNGSKDYPTLFELRHLVAKNIHANHPARQALLDSLDPILHSLRSVLAYQQGWKTGDLAKRKIVFEFAGLAEVDKDLILNTLLLGEFTSRIARGMSNDRMDLMVSCDEAARLIASGRDSIGIGDLIGLVRGTGIGLDLAVQSASVLSSVLSNTANKFIGRCGSAADYDLIGSAMGLTIEQRRWMSLNLRPGLFAGQLGEGAWRYPFVFEVPYIDLRSLAGTSATDIRRGCGDLVHLPTVPYLGHVHRVGSEDEPLRESNGQSSSSTNQGGQTSLSGSALRFLRVVVDQPGQPSSAYAKLAGMSSKTAKSARCELLTAGLIREHRLQTGARGRSSIIIESLAQAQRLVDCEANDNSGGAGS